MCTSMVSTVMKSYHHNSVMSWIWDSQWVRIQNVVIVRVLCRYHSVGTGRQGSTGCNHSQNVWILSDQQLGLMASISILIVLELMRSFPEQNTTSIVIKRFILHTIWSYKYMSLFLLYCNILGSWFQSVKKISFIYTDSASLIFFETAI